MNRAEMYVRNLIVGDEPSDSSSVANALSTYEVDPLSSHRATKPKKKTTTKNLNKTSNLKECEDSLASTSDEQEEEEEDFLQGDVEDLSTGSKGARHRVRSRQFNITLKRAIQTD
ncbi:unnamed protein product, partial [Pocillopora meandrina]